MQMLMKVGVRVKVMMLNEVAVLIANWKWDEGGIINMVKIIKEGEECGVGRETNGCSKTRKTTQKKRTYVLMRIF